MSRWIFRFVLGAICVQVGCQPEAKIPPSESRDSDQEIDGARLVRLGSRVHVAPAFTGTAVWKYPNGNRRTARTFKNGILEGPMVSWYDDGKTQRYSVAYKANKKDGVATGYFKDGKKKYEINYIKGVRDNIETWWHSNGKKQYEFEWAQGVRKSTTAWNNQGTKIEIPKGKSKAPLRQPGKAPSSKGKSPLSTNRPPSKASPPQSNAESTPKDK